MISFIELEIISQNNEVLRLAHDTVTTDNYELKKHVTVYWYMCARSLLIQSIEGRRRVPCGQKRRPVDAENSMVV